MTQRTLYFKKVTSDPDLLKQSIDTLESVRKDIVTMLRMYHSGEFDTMETVARNAIVKAKSVTNGIGERKTLQDIYNGLKKMYSELLDDFISLCNHYDIDGEDDDIVFGDINGIGSGLASLKDYIESMQDD